MQVGAARLLFRPLSKALSWWALFWSSAVAIPIVWWLGTVTTDVVLALRLGGLCLAAGMAFTLDDPAEEGTSMMPVSLLSRRLVRISLSLPVVVVVWLLLAGVANRSQAADTEVPVWPFIVEFLAFGAVALSGATVGGRYVADRLGGTIGAGAAVVLAAAAAFSPGAFRLWNQMPGTSGYASSTKWWWAILLVGGIALIRSSRVGARPLRSMLRRRPGLESVQTTRLRTP